MFFLKNKPKMCEKWSDEQVDAFSALVIVLSAVLAVYFWLSGMSS